ncbi:MAG: hypothetical protein QG641_1907 [Candidatus Poribacteria bacterium]|nr:hypothetical protein [Candidatus Poribacteria bacterium]
MRRYKLILAIALIIVSSTAFSQTGIASSDGIWDVQYRGVRPMGMGNAFGAVSDDNNAFYYNPAGLAFVRKLRIDIQPVHLIPTEDFYNETKDINDLTDDIDRISKSSNPLEDPNLKYERIRLMNRLERLASERVGIDAGFPLSVMIPLHIKNYGVTLGIMGHGWSVSQIKVQKKGLQWGNLVLDVLDDDIFYKIMGETSYGLASAINLPIPMTPVAFSVGVTAMRVEQWLLTDENDLMNFGDLVNSNTNDFKKRFFDPEDPLSSIANGSGYRLNAGIIASLGDAFKMGLAFNNILSKINYDIIKDNAPNRLAGVSAAVNLTKLPSPDIPMVDAILSASIDDMNSDNTKKRVGFELTWKPIGIFALSGRVGSNDGFLTLGAGIKLIFLDIDYAFYGDEVTNWHAVSLNLAF